MDIAKLIRKSMKRMSQSTLPFFQSQLFYQLDQDAEQVNGVDGFFKILNQQKTNAQRVDCLYQKLQKYDMLHDKFKPDRKSDLKGLKYKERGNKFFGVGKFNKALRTYTKTLMKAEGQELRALGYANRSAALFKLGLFEECLTDIERALANNYPEHLKSKLITRKAKSAELLQKSKKTTQFFEEPPKIPTSQKNPMVQCASDCVEIKTGKNRKYVVATTDIQIGDVIAVEAPFTASIEEAYLYHCHNCFNLCYNPVPCDVCTQTLYCGEECKLQALTKYHKDECPILLSLRKLVGKNTNFLLAIKMVFHERDEQCDEILHLSESLDDKDSNKESLKFAMAVAFMFDLVKKHTKRFEGENGEAAEKVFKDFMLTYARLCVDQATGIDELCPGEVNNEENLYQETVACAIYPFYGLFRHSCCPNVFAQHHGLKRVLRAIRTIKKGQECLVSFGPHYIQEDREERQNRLFMQYRFKCTCRACKNNWPQLDLLPYPRPAEEDLLFMYEIRAANVELAKRTISRKIAKMKQLERFEPRADLTFQQKILLHCYDVLGNKRMIQ